MKLDQFINRQARIEMTPMIDIVFNILIFFIMVSTFSAYPDVIPPTVGQGNPSQFEKYGPHAVVVRSNPKLPLVYGGVEIEIDRLVEKLKVDIENLPEGKQLVVLIVADRSGLFERVREVFSSCSRAGVTRIRMGALLQDGGGEK